MPLKIHIKLIDTIIAATVKGKETWCRGDAVAQNKNKAACTQQTTAPEHSVIHVCENDFEILRRKKGGGRRAAKIDLHGKNCFRLPHQNKGRCHAREKQ